MPRSPAEKELDRIEEQARAEAKEIVDRIDQLSLIGHPTSFDEQTRDVVEAVIRHRLTQALVSECNRHAS